MATNFLKNDQAAEKLEKKMISKNEDPKIKLSYKLIRKKKLFWEA